MRAAVIGQVNQIPEGIFESPEVTKETEVVLQEEDTENNKRKGKAWYYTWAMLLSRIYEVFPLICPGCQKPMKIIAFITEDEVVAHILTSIGNQRRHPRLPG